MNRAAMWATMAGAILLGVMAAYILIPVTGTAVEAQTISGADMTATALCLVPQDPVMLYEIFGTPTPSPVPVSALPSPTPQVGDVTNGETLFHSAAACNACHTTNGEWLVGPSMLGISQRAGLKGVDVLAQDYLRSVINDPKNVYPSIFPGVMPITYSQSLTAEQIEDLIAYLMTL